MQKNRRQFRCLPEFDSVHVSSGLTWFGGGEWRVEEKIDGWFCEADSTGLFYKNSSSILPSQMPFELSAHRLAGELKNGVLHVFDVISVGNLDVWKMPLIDRLKYLDEAKQHFPDWMKTVRHGTGGEFLEMILSEGGEGVVAKKLGSFWGKSGAWIKCKRSESHDCRVISFDEDLMSVELANGRGRCRVTEPVAVGSIIEVQCHSIHKSGKFREPVFVRPRPDLTPSA